MSTHDDGLEPFDRLAREIRLAFHQLKAVAEAVDRDRDGLTAAHRGVLESLARGGPATVPALARARPVSRQHIQILVNRLLELELVRTDPNPAHERSPLIALTAAGTKRFETMQRRERQVLARAHFPVSARQMNEAAKTLQELREFLSTFTAG
ncbi:MAG TPA: helix-turn-helix domain-containing protein [Polyangiaceae bacterium]